MSDTLAGLRRVYDLAITQTPRPDTLQRFSESLHRAAINRVRHVALEEINRYSRYQRGWDGYDGEPFHRRTIEVAKAYVVAVTAFLTDRGAGTFDIIPGAAPDGSLDVEIRLRNKRLIITIYPGVTTAEVQTYREQGHEKSSQTVSDNHSVVKDLYWLVA